MKHCEDQCAGEHCITRLPLAVPPPLRQLHAPQLPSDEGTLSYLCVPTHQQLQQQQSRLHGQRRLHSDKSVLELALVTRRRNSNDVELHKTCTSSSSISPVDIHAFFSCPRNAPLSPLCTPIPHHPVFARCCPRPQYRLFDVVYHSGNYSCGENKERTSAVAQLKEALKLAFTAHTGTAAVSTETSQDSENSHLGSVVRSLCCVVFRLCPPSVLSFLSFALTMVSPVEARTMSLEDSLNASAVLPIDLHWSWVPNLNVRPSMTMKNATSTNALKSQHDTLSHTHFEPLWQYWLNLMTVVNIDPGNSDEPSFEKRAREYASCNDAASIYRRLKLHVQRAKDGLFRNYDADTTSTREQHGTEQMLCVLLAVFAEASMLERYWASPLIPLSLHNPHTFKRCLHLWFTFIGLATNANAVAVEVQANVEAALLDPLCCLEYSCSGMPDAQPPLPTHVRLHRLCQWLTTKVLGLILRWMPSTVLADSNEWEQAAQRAVPFHLRETHILFRGVTEAFHQRSKTPLKRQHMDPSLRNMDNESGFGALHFCAATKLHATRLFDQLFECVTGHALLTAEQGCASPHKHLQPLSTLTQSLFTHPAQHGVVVCRLHLNARLNAIGIDTPPHRHVLPLPAIRGPVAAILTWYAVDFEDVFRQAYRSWALAQRYTFRVSNASGQFLDNCTDYEGMQSLAGGIPVDPAIVCDTRVNPLATEQCHHKGLQLNLFSESTPRTKEDKTAATTSTPLGLLGRCLLLGLWMLLKLRDVDLEEDVDMSNEDHRTTWQSSLNHAHATNEADALRGGGTRGTLFYSSRRNMLFARDWRTVQQLHGVLVGTSATTPRETCSLASLFPSEVAVADYYQVKARTTVAAATVVVLQAFLRARSSQQQTTVIAFRRKVEEELQNEIRRQQRRVARQLHATTVLQAWVRAHQSRKLVIQVGKMRLSANIPTSDPKWNDDDDATRSEALSVSTGLDGQEDEEEECVLLQWSAVEDASVSSFASLEAIVTSNSPKITLCTPSRMETATNKDGARLVHAPARILSGDASFTTAVAKTVAPSPKCRPTSSPSSSTATVTVTTAAPVTLPCSVTPALALGQRHLIDLEVHERALLWRTAVSELLWLTSLLECVGRRAQEASEKLAWRTLVAAEVEEKKKNCKHYNTVLISGVQQQSGATFLTSRRGVQLHNDENAPVAAILSLSPSTVLPPAQTTTCQEKYPIESMKSLLCSEEEKAREVLYKVEECTRAYVYTDQLRHAEQLMLFHEEQLRRHSLRQLWDLEQQEWQARWTTAVLPECVLRELYREFFLEEHPQKQQQQQHLTFVSQSDVHKINQARQAKITGVRTTTKSSAAPNCVSSSPKVATASRVVEDAKVHRAFLLQDGEELAEETRKETKQLFHKSVPSRRSASPMPPTPSDSKPGNRRSKASPPPSHSVNLNQSQGTPQTHLPLSSSLTPVSQVSAECRRVLLSSKKGGSSISSSKRGNECDFSPSPRAPSAPQCCPSPPAAHPATATTRSKSIVPVVSVSLGRDSDEDDDNVYDSFTRLRERCINQMSITSRKTGSSSPTSTNEVLGKKAHHDDSGTDKTLNRSADSTAFSAVPLATTPPTWWWVPLNSDDKNKSASSQSRPVLSPPTRCDWPLAGTGRSTSHVGLPSRARPTTEAVPVNKRNTTLFLKQQSRKGKSDVSVRDDVASAVAAAIALARDSSSGACDRGSAAIPRTFSRAQLPSASETHKSETPQGKLQPATARSVNGDKEPQQRTALDIKSVVPPLLSRPPRKRYVTWADDVPED